VVNGVTYDYKVKDGIEDAELAKTLTTRRPIVAYTGNVGKAHSVESPLPGLVLKILKSVGDPVARGEPVVVMESMKMENPINSPIDGFVQELCAKQGEQIEAGRVIFTVGEAAQGAPQSAPADSALAASPSAPASGAAAGTGPQNTIDSPLPGLILRVNKKAGDAVAAGEPILVMESMKMENPINSPVNGVVESVEVKQGEQVQSGQHLATVRG
jgi:biotin carboxyl carrier protein